MMHLEFEENARTGLQGFKVAEHFEILISSFKIKKNW